MRRRRLFASSGLIIFFFFILFLPRFKGFLETEKVTQSSVQTQTAFQPQPAVQEQPVIESQKTVSPEAIQEGLNKFRAFKKNKIYENVARQFIALGLTKDELANLNDHQKDLLNHIVSFYDQAKSNNFDEIFKARDLAKPFMDEFKKEFNLPRPKPVLESSQTSSSGSKEFSDYLGTFFDVVGKVQDAALSGLKKGAAVSLLPTPGLSF